jgi:hypothetical protein
MLIRSVIITSLPCRNMNNLQKTGGKCFIWGRKAKAIDVEYLDHEGNKRKSKLLIRWVVDQTHKPSIRTLKHIT